LGGFQAVPALPVFNDKPGHIAFLGHILADRDQLFIEFDAVDNGIPQLQQLRGLLLVMGHEFHGVLIDADFHGASSFDGFIHTNTDG
jgi:hypothetical protein